MLGILARSRSFRIGGGGGAGGGGAGGSGGGAHAGGDSKAHGQNGPVAAEPAIVSGPTLQNSTVLGLVENARFPPRPSTEEGKNPYANRPLPPPPPPKNASAMPRRPATSSGSNAAATAAGSSKGLGRPTFDKRISRDDMFLTSSSRRPDFDKRISRDDMYVGTRASRGFHVPIRSNLATPEVSPGYVVPRFAAPPARMATPESLASGEIQIGMALGSPTQPPPAIPSEWQTSAPAVDETREPPALQRSKTGRRKLFGFFGGSKKHQELPRTTPAVESSEPSTTLMTSALPASQNASDRLPARSNTTADRKPKYQPIVIRTNTEPFNPSPVKEKETRGPRLFLRSKASEPAIRQQQESAAVSSQDTLRPTVPEIPPPIIPVPAPAAGPFLDVEIPDVKLERYSVMFGSLLHPQQQQQPSALLARRQATLDKLKTINDQILREEEEARERSRQQRRATSPQPAKSPAFTLFPPTPSIKHAGSPSVTPRKLSPRMRSNTSPAMLPSPVKTTFDHEPVPKDQSRGEFLRVDPLRGNPTMMVPADPPARETVREAAPKVFQFDSTHSNLILDSPTDVSSSEEDDSRLTGPFIPVIPEPQWQMISPSSSAAPSTTSSASSLRKRSPSSVSSVQTHVTKPSVDIDEADPTLKSAVEISIARQISISRQQRQMLRPLKTNVKSRPSQSPSPNAASSSSSSRTSPVKKLGKNEKLSETKFSTPTLVHPEETLDSQLANRKSSRVVLEAA